MELVRRESEVVYILHAIVIRVVLSRFSTIPNYTTYAELWKHYKKISIVEEVTDDYSSKLVPFSASSISSFSYLFCLFQ